ncbi:recombinase family protein [Streptomyces sp. NPDC050508]|uniref:recombinase family protein n=1 Tax=Streptomyces sp. NPDC050508 TaxID=3155405 RepID=UPI00342ED1DD
MRQSTTPHRGQDWMAQERATDEWLRPDRVRIEPDPLTRLMIARRATVERVVQQLRTNGRVPRVCLYALAVGGHVPTHSLNAARAFAEQQGWQVATEDYTDCHGTTGPMARPGWDQVRQRIRAGLADGVVVLTQTMISLRLDEYERQLAWLDEHFGFITLVIPERDTAAVQE